MKTTDIFFFFVSYILHGKTKKMYKYVYIIYVGTAAKRTMSNMINDYMHSQVPASGQIVESNTFTITNPAGQRVDFDMSSAQPSRSGPGLPSDFRKSTDITDIDYNPSYNGRKITDMTDEIYNDIMEASSNVLNMNIQIRPGLIQYQQSNPSPIANRPGSPRLNQYQYSNPNPVIPRPNHLVHPQQFMNQNLHAYRGVPPQNRHRDQYRVASESDIVTKGGNSQYLGVDIDNDDIKSGPLPVSPVVSHDDEQDIYIKTNMRNHVRDRSMENDDANSTASDHGEGADDITPSTGENRVYKRTMGGDDDENDSSEAHTPNDSNDDIHNIGGASPTDATDNELYMNGNVILPRYGNESGTLI